PCVSGRPALCEPGADANARGVLLGGERRLHQGAEALNHHLGVSCFAEYAVVSRRSCVKLEHDLTFHEAALFGCAVLTGAGAVINRARLKPGDSLAIVGLGGVGLSALMAAIAAGARRVVGVEPDAGKRELARTLGATHLVDPLQLRSVADLLDAAGGPVDVGYDAAGVVAAFQNAYALTRRGGLTLTTGLPHPDATFALPIAELVGQEREIRGSYLGSGAPALDIPRYVELYRAGRLPVDRLIGRSFALDDINAGFDHLASGSGLRDSIVFDA
ncbi:MAG: zinc-binding dehydrogenase, partial [Ottowia sp.]|nr:zinc-binding dehydrogenase [Ottowia sp.]